MDSNEPETASLTSQAAQGFAQLSVDIQEEIICLLKLLLSSE